VNPLRLYVLSTTESAASGTGHRTFIDVDEAALQTFGDTLRAQKPTEITSLTFVISDAQGIR
jgi:hypothetical protein